MSVLTSPRSVAFSRQMVLPFTPMQALATRPMRTDGPAGLLREPPRSLAKAQSDKPGST